MATKKEKEKPTQLSGLDIKTKLDEIVDDMLRIKELQEKVKGDIKKIVDGSGDDAVSATVVRKAATAILNQKVEELDKANQAVMTLIDTYNGN